MSDFFDSEIVDHLYRVDFESRRDRIFTVPTLNDADLGGAVY